VDDVGFRRHATADMQTMHVLPAPRPRHSSGDARRNAAMSGVHYVMRPRTLYFCATGSHTRDALLGGGGLRAHILKSRVELARFGKEFY
jgi:hypothetical protein